MAPVTVAVWQFAPVARDVHGNASALFDAAQRAADEGAVLLVTPELTLTGYDIGDLDGELLSGAVQTVRRVAREARIALVAGVARYDEDGECRNSSVIVDGMGRVLDIYDKAHLFGGLDVDRFAPGPRTHGIADVAGLRVATVICYDVEFPETIRAAALDNAQLVAVPTANMSPFQTVNRILVPARAVENSVYVAYANHHGVEGDTQYVGESCIVAPDGTSAVAPGTMDHLVLAEVDPDAVTAMRAASTSYLTDRRPELYEELVNDPRAVGEERS